ncbi:MAG: hypothetical protein EO766_12375 [Hydrotalea sp. AMD]|uniref:metallophosphoesterase n=1 Tax=Hydrotalea sp. AMD TaxID=2501297 RepID=UPI0010280690|nr:metallophosphoesterase [Hydrotalea sp. AMD]RWZ87314.1 MAG: hypothetical protein EO766_12375 [Hydrotalea sp. AMD]
MSYQKHLHLPTNTKGQDYIVGDLHGHYDILMELLSRINFNPEVDRLISCGDMIDRGPDSLKCAELIYEDYFYCTLGNHELMMIQSILKGNSQYHETWIYNGGLWHKAYSKEELTQLAWDIAHKPLIISVGENENRFNITHAELVAYNHYHELQLIDNSWIDDWKFNSGQEDDILWGRQIFNAHWSYHQNKRIFTKRQFHSNQLSPTYVGHTMTQNSDLIQFQQHIYLDTGISLGNKLSIASPTLNKYFQLDHKHFLTTKNLNDITKINTP